MQQTQNQPLYAAKDRVPFNLTLVLALGIAAWGAGAVFGLWDMGGNPSLIFLLGVAVAIYTWLFTPREYLVYSDALCVAYGRPRIKAIHFSNIATVEMGSLATIDQLRIRPVKGRRQSIRVRDPETFYDQLEMALNAYRDAHPEEGMDVHFTGRFPPEAMEGEPVAVAGDDVDAEPVATPAEDVLPEGQGESQDSPSDRPAAEASTEVSDSAEDTEPAVETTPEDQEKPQEPGSRGFY